MTDLWLLWTKEGGLGPPCFVWTWALSSIGPSAHLLKTHFMQSEMDHVWEQDTCAGGSHPHGGSSSSGLVCSPSCWLGWQSVRVWTFLAAGLHPSWASPVWKGATTTFRTLSETQAFTGSPWGSPLSLSTAGLFTLTINYFLLLKELHQEAQLQIAMLKALRSNAAFHYQRQQDKYYFTCMDPEFLRNLFIKCCFFCCGKL